MGEIFNVCRSSLVEHDTEIQCFVFSNEHRFAVHRGNWGLMMTTVFAGVN